MAKQIFNGADSPYHHILSAEQSLPTMPQLQRRSFDQPKWTALEIENPCALLVECGRNLVVMLAKHCRSYARGKRLAGIRLITIPNGLRLRWLELRASLGPARLSDEWLFMKGAVRSDQDLHRLIVDGSLFRTSAEPFPIEMLTKVQYHELLWCSGRLLRARLVSMFEQWLPASVVSHRPWMLSSGGHSQARPPTHPFTA